jgi:hypothetical protein
MRRPGRTIARTFRPEVTTTRKTLIRVFTFINTVIRISRTTTKTWKTTGAFAYATPTRKMTRPLGATRTSRKTLTGTTRLINFRKFTFINPVIRINRATPTVTSGMNPQPTRNSRHFLFSFGLPFWAV